MSLGTYLKVDNKKHMSKRNWSTCSKYDSKLTNEHDWGGGGLYDHPMNSKKPLTFI